MSINPEVDPTLPTAEKDIALMPQGMQPGQTMTTTSRVGEDTGEAPQLIKKDIGTAFQQDILRQRGRQQSTAELSSKFSSIVDSPDIQSAVQANDNNPVFAGLALSSGLLQKLKTDDAFRNQTLQDYVTSQKAAIADPSQPVVAGEFGLPEEFFEGTDFEFKQAMDSIINKNVRIRDALQTENPYFGLDGKRMIMSKFAVGDTYEEAIRTVANLPGDLARIPYIFPLVANGVEAAYKAATGPRDFDEGLEMNFNQLMKTANVIPGFTIQDMEAGLNKFQVTENRIKSMQRWYKKNFIETYGLSEWENQHTEAMTELNPDTGLKQYVTDDDGVIQRKEIDLPYDVASSMVELAFDELPFASKVGLIFATQAGLTGGFVALSGRGGRAMSKRVDMARINEDGTANVNFANKTDLEVFEILRREDYKNATNAFTLAYFSGRDAIERVGVGSFRPVRQIGKFGRKSKLNMGATYRDFDNTVNMYDEKISALSKEINGLTPKIGTQIDPKNAARIDILKKQRAKLESDKKRYTGVINKNPYLIAAMRDEVIISTAIGASMQFMPNMDVYGVPAELIVGITSPMLAPALAAGVAKIGYKAGDSITEGLFSDIGELLQSSEMFEFIPRDALLKGDESIMREALKASGYDLTDERVKSFRQFARIMNALPTTDKRGGNPRQEVADALVRYKDMMKSYETELNGLGYDAETTTQVMSKLNLSIAQASGLAPLLAYQQGKVRNVTSGDIVDPNSLQDLIRHTADEQALSLGIDANLKIIRDLLAKDGIRMGENSPLQKFIGDLETGAENQRQVLREKQQALVLMFDQYTRNIAQLDKDFDDTKVQNMLQMAEELESMSILPGGTVKGLVDKGELLETAHANMLQSVADQSEALATFSHKASKNEFFEASRLNADNLLDITIGARKARASAKYKEVDVLLDGRTFDMTEPLQKLMALSGDMIDSPITQNLTDLGKFVKTDGKLVQRTFDTMAYRNLQKEFGFSSQDLDAYMKENNMTALEIAIEVIQNKQDPEAAARLFSASFDEAENLYRFFELRAVGGKTETADVNKVRSEVRQLITKAYGDLDPAVKTKIEEARRFYAENVGQVTDTSVSFAWAGPALSNRVRKDMANRPKSEGYYGYKNVDRAHPEVPFKNMAKITQKLLKTNDASEVADLKRQLFEEQDRVLFAVGARRNENGRMEFDLEDPVQAEAFKIYKGLVQAHQQYAISSSFRTQADVTVDLLQEGMDDIQKIGFNNLNFSRATRVMEIEKEFAVDIKGEDTPRRTFEADALKDFAVNFDDLLLNNKKYQKNYNSLREELDPVKGVLTIAAKQEAEDMNKIIRTLELDAALVNKKEVFFDMKFANATPESYDRMVDQLAVTSKLPKAEVKKALKFMYAEGLMAKSNLRNNRRKGKDVQELQGELFSDIVTNPEQNKLARHVLGDKHVDAFERMQNWIDTSMGDALDFRRAGIRGVMTIESAFSRIFNVARGMVSPLYVGTELATRAHLLSKQNLMDAALSDPEAAMIMADVLFNVDLNERKINTLGIRLKAHLAKGVAKSGQNIPTLEDIMAQEEHFRTYGTIVNPIKTSEDNKEDEDETVQ